MGDLVNLGLGLLSAFNLSLSLSLSLFLHCIFISSSYFKASLSLSVFSLCCFFGAFFLIFSLSRERKRSCAGEKIHTSSLVLLCFSVFSLFFRSILLFRFGKSLRFPFIVFPRSAGGYCSDMNASMCFFFFFLSCLVVWFLTTED